MCEVRQAAVRWIENNIRIARPDESAAHELAEGLEAIAAEKSWPIEEIIEWIHEQRAGALQEAHDWLAWQSAELELYHAYCQRFQREPGANIFELVLIDALRSRGWTLERFRAECGLVNTPPRTNPPAETPA